jgi:hypothetical protein
MFNGSGNWYNATLIICLVAVGSLVLRKLAHSSYVNFSSVIRLYRDINHIILSRIPYLVHLDELFFSVTFYR